MRPKLLDPDAMPPWLARNLNGKKFARHVIAAVNEDDCAVIEWKAGYLVITTDFLNARPMAMELGIASPRILGRLTVASSLSDLCGSGAQPQAILVATMMARGSTEREFQEFMRGAMSEAHRWRIPVVGGDTKLGASNAFLGIAVGMAHARRNLFLKSGAEAGDILWASGNLGSCCAAVLGFKRKDVTLSWRRWAVTAITQPRLPLRKSAAVSNAQVGHGGIDVSDGFGRDVYRLATASRLGVVVELADLPIAAPVRDIASTLGIPAWHFPFGTGGDFQFLVTTPRRASKFMRRTGFHQIGYMTADRKMVLRHPDGHCDRLPQEGHRDARGMTFLNEIRSLIQGVRHA